MRTAPLWIFFSPDGLTTICIVQREGIVFQHWAKDESGKETWITSAKPGVRYLSPNPHLYRIEYFPASGDIWSHELGW